MSRVKRDFMNFVS